MRQSMDHNTTPPSKTCIIEGCLYLRHPTPTAYDIKVHELGDGHTEAVVMPHYSWSELDCLSPSALADYTAALLNPPAPTPLELLDRAARSADNAKKRAKTAVRRLVKDKNLDQMLTLTYRENVTDRDTHLRNFDVFIKRVRRAVPSFEFVVTHERQERGAWHSHIAVRRILPVYMYQGQLVKSYSLLTHLWRASQSSGGTCHASKFTSSKRRDVAQIATYLSKYIGKSLGDEVPKYGNSYSASDGRPAPPVTIRVPRQNLFDAVIDLHALLPETLGKVYTALLPGSMFYLAASPPRSP